MASFSTRAEDSDFIFIHGCDKEELEKAKIEEDAPPNIGYSVKVGTVRIKFFLKE